MYTGYDRAWGAKLYELLKHLTSRTWQIGDEPGNFRYGIADNYYGAARLQVCLLLEQGSLDEPDYFVDLRCVDGTLQLWYGWKNTTHHLAKTWRPGKWRQDIAYNPSSTLFTHELGAVRQVSSIDDLRQEVTRELESLFRRLSSVRQTSRYALTWDEMAAMLIEFADRWGALGARLQESSRAILLRDTYPQLHHQGRGEPLELRIIHQGSGKPVVTLKATHDLWGWRLDVFTTLSPMSLDLLKACAWQGGIVFPDSPYMASGRRPCPLGHNHQTVVESTMPWSLFEFFRDEWLPLFNEGYARWGVDGYTPLPFSSRTQMEPSETIRKRLTDAGFRPTYRGTDPTRGYEYWQLSVSEVEIIVDPRKLTRIGFLVSYS